VVQGTEFKVFTETMANGGAIKAICVPAAPLTRASRSTRLTEFVKGQGVKVW